MKVQFYPLDVDSIEYEGKSAIRIFGRTKDNKRICIIDTTFEPYFYAIPIQEELTKVKWNIADLNGVKDTKTVKKKLLGEEVNAIQIITNDSKDVPTLRHEVKRKWGVQKVLESDISFYRRYLIDKGITTLALCEVEGEELELNLAVDLIIQANSVKQISEEILETPKILAFDIETYNIQKVPREDLDPVVMIGFSGSDGFKKVLTWKKFKNPKDYVEFLSTEREMIERFKDIVSEYAPDYLTGYFTDGFDFPYLKKRADINKVKLDINLDNTNLKISVRNEVSTARTKGLVHLDIFKFISRTMTGGLETAHYDLDSVAKELLGEGKAEVDIAELADVWDNKPERLSEFCEYNLKDTDLTLKLVQKVLPGLNEFVKLVGQPIYEVSRMSYGQLVEWFIIRKLQEFNELTPDRPKSDDIVERRMATFEGAFVFEPIPGIYDNLVVFDFKSLYPSIITSHNICPSTLRNDKKGIPTPEITMGKDKIKYYFDDKKQGFIPKILEEVIVKKNKVTAALKKDKTNATLSGKKYAYKILANSFYGYYGFAGARWYCIECAAGTTAYGRDYIQKTIKKAQDEGFKVIYGDTDSCMLVLDKKTKEDALKFKEEINKDLPGLMELDLEGFYPRGIFVSKKDGVKGAKKKYALLNEAGKINITGFETIRGDWSVLAKEVQHRVFELILKENNKEKAVEYVKDVIKEIRNRKIPLEKMIMGRQLRKELSEYEAVGPHVAVAKIMQERGLHVGPGTFVQYIVNEGKGIIRDRAKLPEDSKNYDVEYYIGHQVLPAVDKIMEVLGYTKKDLSEGNSQSTLGDY